MSTILEKPVVRFLSDLQETGGLKGTLYDEWQAYQAELGPIETQIAEAKAKEQAAFDALAQIQSGTSVV